MTAPDDVRARLLPCPFCGGMARLCIGYHAKYDVKVACDDCSSEGVLYGEDDFKGDHAEEWKRSAITAWNRRASPADLSGDVRELVDKGQALAAIVRKQCGGYLSGPGFDALNAAIELDAALAKHTHQEKP